MKVKVSFEATSNEELIWLHQILDQATDVIADSTRIPASVADAPIVPPTLEAPPAPVAGNTIPSADTIVALGTTSPGIPAPIAPAEPPATDGTGVPWNGDYHAGTKTQTKAGRWKRRKGLSADEKAASDIYEAGYTAPSGAVAAMAPTAVPSVAPEPPVPTAAPVMPGMSIPADVNNPFTILNHKINKIVAEGHAPGPQGSMLAEKGVNLAASPDKVVDGLLRVYGVEGFGDLQTHPDQWPFIIQAVDLIWPQVA